MSFENNLFQAAQSRAMRGDVLWTLGAVLVGALVCVALWFLWPAPVRAAALAPPLQGQGEASSIASELEGKT